MTPPKGIDDFNNFLSYLETAPTNDDNITEKEVRALFELWNSALGIGYWRFTDCRESIHKGKLTSSHSFSRADKTTFNANASDTYTNTNQLLLVAVTSPPPNRL